MNYFIKRELQEYGPYSLAELQRYVASGNVLLTDLCRSEGMTEWVPVSQVIGNIPVPVAPAPAAAAMLQPSPYPPPPSLHWGIVVLLTVLTCGLFGWAWIFVQAIWLKKVQPNSKGILYFSAALGTILLMFASIFAFGMTGRAGEGNESILVVTIIARIALLILIIAGSFNMKNSIEEHYNTAEPIGLDLNGGLTFLFAFFFLIDIYFQYHFTRINELKRRQGQII